jgi:hypothetical protein
MSYLQLPPVHGYGVPQILSQWQAGLDSRENQKRYETELAFKKKESARAEKQFDMQMETHKANIENIQSAQRIAIGDQGFKLADYADKLAEDPSKAPMANEIRKQAYGRWEKAFGITFDVEAINKLNGLSLQAKEEESQILNGIQKGLDAGRNGDIKSLYKVNDALTAIENNKKLKPNIIVALREQVKTAMDNIQKQGKDQPLSPQGELQSDIKSGFLTQDQAQKPAEPPIPTDIDDYVADANAESLRTTGKPLTPGEMNKARLEFKRTQPEEAGAVRAAQEESTWKTKNKYIEEFNESARQGTMLAEIKNNVALMESRGEVGDVDKKKQAGSRISGVLAEMADHYKTLNIKKAIVSVDNTVSENAMASLSASGVGQYVQKVLGTESQSLRNSIKNSQPLLINYIRQASEMGAKGLDSEKELAFYLQAATDPTRDIQSNIAALVILDEAYGTGELGDVFRKTLDSKLLKRMKQEGERIRETDKPQETEVTATNPKTGEVLVLRNGKWEKK